MSKFEDAMKKKQPVLGNRRVNSDEALGVNFKDAENIRLAEVRLDSLETNPYQPRSSMDEEKLEELKNSILERGLLQPIIVCPLESNPKKFQIIAGHRRTEAVKRIGKEYISAIIVKDQSQDLKIDSLIENIQRDDLSPIDVAFAVKRIMEEGGLKQVDIIKLLGKTKGYVSSILKICTLPEQILEHQKTNQVLPMSILFQISAIEDEKQKIEVFNTAFEKELSRVEVKALIDSMNSTKEPADSQKATEKKALEKESFVYKANKKKVSFSLDLTDEKACVLAIKELEELLKKLKTKKV